MIGVIWEPSGEMPMSMDKIEHVVVLMLENRSFDSLLGWLYEDRPQDQFRGLQGIDLAKFENKAGSFAVKPTRGADGFTVPTVDPGEEFEHVLQQFYDTRSPKDGQQVTMTGVLSDFVSVLGPKVKGDDLAQVARTIMQSYTPSQFP
jgi:phospholipase C